MCVCVYLYDLCQKMPCASWPSLSTILVLGINSGPLDKCLYPLSHFRSPTHSSYTLPLKDTREGLPGDAQLALGLGLTSDTFPCPCSICVSESTGTTWHSEHGTCQAGAAGELRFMEIVETAEFKGSRFSAGAWDRTETTPAPGRNVEEGNWAGRLGDPLVVRKDRGLCGRAEAAG